LEGGFMKGIFDKWAGGAKKNGGIAASMGKQMDQWGRDADEALGSPSHLKSSDTAKRKVAENGLKDIAHAVTGGVAYPGASALEDEVVVDESLKALVLAYLGENSETLGEETIIAIKAVIEKSDDSDADVVVNVLTFGNLEVSAFVKNWVMEHAVEEANVVKLREIAGAYFADHSSETDVALAIGTGGEAVSTLAPALFNTNHPELSADVTTHLLGVEVDLVL
jgi:hypothetical protein